jgi:glycine dehydrogenase subunit 1
VQTPDFYGHLRDIKAAADAAHEAGALLIVVVTEVVSLGLLEAPGALGADIVVCEGQSIGNALNFGGPYVGLMATRRSSSARCPAGSAARPSMPTAARLRADAVDPRAAYPPREGDQQYLHQFGPLRAGLLDPHVAARRSRVQAAGAPQSPQCGEAGDAMLAPCPASTVLNKTFFNEMTIRLPVPAAPMIERWPRAFWPACRSAGWSRNRVGRRTSSSSPRPN